MLVSYTRQRGLVRGVVETFDGKHPCKMCAKAAELRKNEGKGDPLNRPQEKKPIRFAWGEMVNPHHLVVTGDSGIDCLKLPASAKPDTTGRAKDSPVVPPPERV